MNGGNMKWISMLSILSLVIIIGCSSNTDQTGNDDQAAEPAINLEYTTPDPIPVPERMVVQSDTDWKARANNKNIEVIEVVNILNPIAAYIAAAFEKYGAGFSPTLNEEWHDTQAQLTSALNLWGDCKKRLEKKQYSKDLFLDLEETWQLLVKTGVAGVRAKSMVDAEMVKLTR